MPEATESFSQLARGAVLALAFLAALALERWRPHARLRPEWGANLGLLVIDTVVMTAVCGACGVLVADWAQTHGVGLIAALGGGPALAAAVTLLGLDAVSYGWHRANHRIPLLWRFHRVHHADENFHVTTALRFHPGELLLALPVRLAAIVALGASPVGVLVFEILFGIANLLEHGNFDLPRRFEPSAQRLLITPALHRAHHARNWDDLDTNFGTILSIWDRGCRTFRASDARRRFATGVPDVAPGAHAGLGTALWLPFARDARRRAR